MNCIIQFIRGGAEIIGYFILGVIMIGLFSQLLYGRGDYDQRSN